MKLDFVSPKRHRSPQFSKFADASVVALSQNKHQAKI